MPSSREAYLAMLGMCIPTVHRIRFWAQVSPEEKVDSRSCLWGSPASCGREPPKSRMQRFA